MDPKISELMTTWEVAEKLGLSKPTVAYHAAKGNIEHIIAFGQTLFLVKSVDQFIKNRTLING